MGDHAPTLHHGPYADGPAASPLLGLGVDALERSRLFTATGARMRRMTGLDRLYVAEHNDYLVQVDGDRRVEALVTTLMPPDEDRADEVFGSALSLQNAVLLQLAHEVLGLSEEEALELLSNLYRDGYLPRTFGDTRLAFIAGKRFHGQRALCLLAARRTDGSSP